MTPFNVWAPDARAIELAVNGRTHKMTPLETGWWQAENIAAKPGDRYGFIVDGQGPFPDPRSRWQPEGIHALSEVYDANAYQWHDQAWRAPPFASAIVYELHIGTFTEAGTFTAVMERLDYLRALGVTHIELMPVAAFSGDWGWGYDGVGLYATHREYGTPDELKLLVDACHQKGLAVILDVVYNHLGPTGNYLAQFGPYFTDRYHTPWGAAVNFDDAQSDEVRRFFIDNALMWLREFRFDGLRLDAVHAILDTSARHFLKQMADEVARLEIEQRRPLVLIAESDLNDPRMIRPTAQGGLGMDAQWSDDFHHALHALLTGERNGYYADFGQVAQLAKALRQGFIFDGNYSQYRKRRHGDTCTGLRGCQLLGYLQTHDQVGNRAKGERSSQLLSADQLKQGAALVLLSPFVPMLFQGEEWAASTPFLYFTHHSEPELAEAVIRGRQNEFAAFGWQPEDVPNPQAVSTFKASKLQWQEQTQAPHAALLDWHRALIELRKSYPEICDGDFARTKVVYDENEKWLCMLRGRLAVCCNFSQQKCTITQPEWLTRRCLLASSDDISLQGERLALPAEGVAILVEQTV